MVNRYVHSEKCSPRDVREVIRILMIIIIVIHIIMIVTIIILIIIVMIIITGARPSGWPRCSVSLCVYCLHFIVCCLFVGIVCVHLFVCLFVCLFACLLVCLVCFVWCSALRPASGRGDRRGVYVAYVVIIMLFAVICLCSIFCVFGHVGIY